jgi:hypothetical protein
MTDREWLVIETAPEGVVVETKIDDEKGARNEQRLKRLGRLWLMEDGSMHVYYTPTHWRPVPPMTIEEHRARHVELHRALDELFADYISHQPLTSSGFLQRPIHDLIKWSHEQSLNPTEPRR